MKIHLIMNPFKVSLRKLSSFALVLLLLTSVVGIAAAEGFWGSGSVSKEEKQRVKIYKQASPAVVFISTVTLTIDPFDLFAGIRPQRGSGSGVIVDADRGIVLTNVHVIENAHEISVLLSENNAFKASLLGYDDLYDIAVLKIKNPPKDLVAISMGDSAGLEVGQTVLAIGNPFGLHKTLTLGIVSSLDRTVKGPAGNLMQGLIQTDAAINPGNSGGPLLDLTGSIIGINTAILSKSGDSAGIGFAVPVNYIKRILPDLIQTGKVQRPVIGWILVDTNQGPMVRRVLSGSPAHSAGVQPIERMVSSVFMKGFVRDFRRADLITEVNGEAVRTSDQVESIVSNVARGKRLSFTLRRGGRRGVPRTVEIQPVWK